MSFVPQAGVLAAPRCSSHRVQQRDHTIDASTTVAGAPNSVYLGHYPFCRLPVSTHRPSPRLVDGHRQEHHEVAHRLKSPAPPACFSRILTKCVELASRTRAQFSWTPSAECEDAREHTYRIYGPAHARKGARLYCFRTLNADCRRPFIEPSLHVAYPMHARGARATSGIIRSLDRIP